LKILSKKQLIILLLGFSSGLPLALTGGTLQAWLREENIDLKTVGFFSAVSLPYTYKFLWAPALDSYSPLGMGRRRGWILFSQIGLILSLLFIGSLHPQSQLLLMSAAAVTIAFLSATQDIAIDAYRREILLDSELGEGAANSQLGYRLGMILSSGVALILADRFSWQIVYGAMAAALLVGVFTLFIAEEERQKVVSSPRLSDFIKPFREFFTRPLWWELIALVLLFKVTDSFAMALTTPFLLDIGFSKTEIGSVLKVIGVTATIFGSLLAGWYMRRIPLRKALIYFGLAQLLANFAYYGLSLVGHNTPIFISAVIIENFGSGLGTAAFVAFLMAITRKEFSATQYSLFTSIAALSRLAVQVPSGIVAEQLGWSNYFILSALLGIPAVLLVAQRFHYWALEGDKPR
jgi:PAT family beta-lactamase induction signal transducer AmpG